MRQFHLNDIAKISGLRWQEPKTFNVIPISRLTSKVLCERHNNALSFLDATVDKFARTIQKFDHGFRPGSTRPPKEERVFSGNDIERWMLKCLIGMVVSANLNNVSLRAECIDLLFDRIDWPEGWGLYWRDSQNGTIYHSESFAVETHIDPSRTVRIATFVIRGMPLTLCLGKPDDPTSFGIRRPTALVFRSTDRERAIVLNWHGPHDDRAILLNRAGTYDGPPPNWEDWEKKL